MEDIVLAAKAEEYDRRAKWYAFFATLGLCLIAVLFDCLLGLGIFGAVDSRRLMTFFFVGVFLTAGVRKLAMFLEIKRLNPKEAEAIRAYIKGKRTLEETYGAQ